MVNMHHSFSMDVDLKIATNSAESFKKKRFRWPFWLASTVTTFMLLVFLVDRIFDSDNFPITDITVKGQATYVDKQRMRQQIFSFLSGNFFSINLDEMKDKIERLPWVYSASVRRQWPSTIVVKIIESEPVAKWGKQKWLDFDGQILHEKKISAKKITTDLPILYADDKPKLIWQSYKSWSSLFAKAGLVVLKLVKDKQDIWYVDVDLNTLAINHNENAVTAASTGYDVHKPFITLTFSGKDKDKQLHRFFNVFGEHLINQFYAIKTIDLRYPNGFAIGWRDQFLKSENFNPEDLFVDNLPSD